jgi:hypothetical protein
VPQSLLRPLVPLTLLGGLCWLVFAASAVVSGADSPDERLVLTSTGDHLGFGLFALCLALAVPAIAALHVHHRGADGRLGRAGALVAAAGAGAQCVVIATIVVRSEEPSWFGVAAPVAILTWLSGSVLLGAAIRRAGIMPPWVSIALPVVTAVAIVGADAGTSALIGAFQVVVALRLAEAHPGFLPGVRVAPTPTGRS